MNEFQEFENIFIKYIFSSPDNSGFIFYNEPNLGAADRGGSLQLWYQSLGLKSMWNPVCYVPMWFVELLFENFVEVRFLSLSVDCRP